MTLANFTGQSLDSVLPQLPPIALDEAITACLSLACQVRELHARGLIHGRINPAAVIVSEDGSLRLVARDAIPDSGGRDGWQWRPAQLSQHGDLELPAEIASTLRVLQAAGLSMTPPQLDLYAVGALLCQFVTHEPPSAYLRSPRIKGQVPARLQTILERTLGCDGREAFADSQELCDALRSALLDEGAAELSAGQETGSVDRSSSLCESDSVGMGTTNDSPQNRLGVALPFSRLGHYQIVEYIGGGGMGDVYRAYERALDRTVAIKVLPSTLAREPDFIDRFRAEATAAAKLIHPNVVQIFYIGHDEGVHFFAMQYVPGESLAELLRTRRQLGQAETLTIIEQLLAGLGAAHRLGLIHRDIKPGNILLDRQSQRALLADFGLVKSLDSPSAGKTSTGVVMGTADYISPEQGRGLAVDARSDLYSLGVLTFQMLSGRLPFEGKSATALIFQHVYDRPPDIRDFVPDIPDELVRIIERLLAKDPADRYPDTSTLLADLQAYRQGLPLPYDSRHAREDGGVHSSAYAATILEPAADLPDEFFAGARPHWWHPYRDRWASMFRRQAPELLAQLQTTGQQIDGAIAACERRVRRLTDELQQGEAILADLTVQAGSDTAGSDANDLRRFITEQEHAVADLRLQLADARAKALKLRGQRDLLNARLKTAQAGTHFAGQPKPKSRTRADLVRSIAFGMLALGVCVLALAISKPELFRSPPTTVESSSPSRSPPTTVLPASSAEVANLDGIPSTVAIAPGAHQSFAVGSRDGRVTFYDVFPNGNERKLLERRDKIQAAAGRISDMVYSHDGQRIAIAGSDDRTISVWDVERGELFRKLEGSPGPIEAVKYSQDDSQLISCGSDGVRIWDLQAGKLLSTIPTGPRRSWPGSIDWSRDGKMFLIGCRVAGAPALALWDLDRQAEVQEFDTSKYEVSDVKFSYDGRQILGVAGKPGDRAVWVWDRSQLAPLRKFGEVDLADFSGDGRRVLTNGPGKVVTLWNAETGERIQDYRGHTKRIVDLAFAANDQFAVSVSEDQTARVWQLPLPPDVDWIPEQPAVAESIAFTPAGDSFFIALQQGGVANLKLGRRQTDKIPDSDGAQLSSVAVSANGKRWLYATGQINSNDNSIVVMESKSRFRTLRGHQDRISGAAFTRDGRQVVSASRDGTIRIWDIQTEAEVFQLKPEVPINGIAIAPAGPPRCLSVGDENVARLWDLETRQELRQFVGHDFILTSAAFTPDGRQAVTASADRTIRVWDVESGNLLKTLKGHTDRVNCVAVSALGDFILSGSDDGTVRRWNPKTGQQLQVCTGHSSPVRSVAIAPNGINGASSGEDRTIRVWKFSTPPGAASTPQTPTLDPIDLLERLDLAKDAVNGSWTREGTALLSAPVADARIRISDYISAEYQLKLVVERITGEGQLKLNLVNLGGLYDLILDAAGGTSSSIAQVRSQRNDLGHSTWNGVLLPPGRKHTILCTVTGRGVDVEVDQRTVLQWSSPPRRLSNVGRGEESRLKELTLDGAEATQFRISEINLVPLQPERDALAEVWDKELQALVAARDGTTFLTLDRATGLGRPTPKPDQIVGGLKGAGAKVPVVRTFEKPEDFHWQQFRLNADGIGFGAIRFQSPFDKPADFHWVYAIEKGGVHWQIMGTGPVIEPFDQLQQERNLELPEGVLPHGNSVILQSLRGGGQIKPGEDYFIWFHFKDQAPVNLYCAIQLTPAGTAPIETTAYGIAQHMGFRMPFRHLDQTHAELRRETGQHPPIHACTVSPDSKWILVSDDLDVLQGPRSVRLLDYQTGALVREFPGFKRRIRTLAFTPDSRRALIHDGEGPAELFDVSTGELALELANTQHIGNQFFGHWIITPDGERALGAWRKFGVWDLTTGKRLVDARIAAEHGIETLILSHDSQQAIAAGADGIIRFLNVNNGVELRQIPNGGRIACIRLSPDGKYLAVADTDNPTIRIWEVNSGKLFREITGHEIGVAAVAFSPDGLRLLSSAGTRSILLHEGQLINEGFAGDSPDHSIRLWDFPSGKELLRIDDHRSYVSQVEFSAAGTEAVSSSGDGTVRVWSLKTPKLSDEIASSTPEHTFEGHTAPVWSVAFSADGRHALSGSGTEGDETDNSVRVWDVAGRTELRKFTGHSAPVRSISAAGRSQVLSASLDGKTCLWNLENLEQATGPGDRPAQVVKFSADGKQFLAGGPQLLERRGIATSDGAWSMDYGGAAVVSLDLDARGGLAICAGEGETALSVWNVETGRLGRELQGHSAAIECVSLAAFGGRALSAGQDGTLRLWDLASGNQLHYFTGHAGPVLCTAISPESRRALSGGADGTVRMWDLDSGIQLWQGEGHTGSVRCVAFSPDGTQALSGAADQRVCLWRLPDLSSDPHTAGTDRDVAEWVLEQGGAVDVEVDGLSYRFDDPQATLPAQGFRLTGVDFSNQPNLGDADLERLKSLMHLKVLSLARSKITNAGLSHLATIVSLETLSLSGTSVTGEGLPSLRPLSRLQTLNLGGLLLSEGDLQQLASLSRLSELTLEKSALSESSYKMLQSLPRLQRLNITSQTPLPQSLLKELRAALPFCQLL